MAGELTVSSQPGVGSRFVFSARLASADPPPAAPMRPIGSVLPGARRRPQVLLAEDDELNAMIAIAFLERADAVVERVHDGKQAVRRALRETQRPDLLLMDCRMPVMDGYQATREIRQQEAILGLPRLPVIALTATVTELGREQCLAAGMDDFLAKPFTLEDLLRVLPQFGQRG
jgi:CheY-like chemotaxis protein